MTKSEVQEPSGANDSFPNEDAEWVIREEPDKTCVWLILRRAVLPLARRRVGLRVQSTRSSVGKGNWLRIT